MSQSFLHDNPSVTPSPCHLPLHRGGFECAAYHAPSQGFPLWEGELVQHSTSQEAFALNKEQLQRTFAWFRAKPGRLTALKAVNYFCTGFTYAAFCGMVGYLALVREPVVVRLVLTCGVSFVLLSLARRALNFPRPYEVYDLPPLLHKETQGKSFPSRHVFSICVIGTSLLYILPPLGAALLVLGALLAVARVVSGVHFVRDVVSGAVIGVLSAVIGFSI